MEAGMGVLGDRSVMPGGAALMTRAGRLVAGIREEGQGPRRLWAGARWLPQPGRSGAAVAGGRGEGFIPGCAGRATKEPRRPARAGRRASLRRGGSVAAREFGGPA